MCFGRFFWTFFWRVSFLDVFGTFLFQTFFECFQTFFERWFFRRFLFRRVLSVFRRFLSVSRRFLNVGFSDVFCSDVFFVRRFFQTFFESVFIRFYPWPYVCSQLCAFDAIGWLHDWWMFEKRRGDWMIGFYHLTRSTLWRGRRISTSWEGSNLDLFRLYSSRNVPY